MRDCQVEMHVAWSRKGPGGCPKLAILPDLWRLNMKTLTACTHTDGKYRFPMELHPEPLPPSGYPLRLLTLVRKEALHSQILPEAHDKIPMVWVAQENTMLREIDLGLDVFIASPLGRLNVKLKTLPGLHPEAVVYRRDDWIKFGGGVNQLIEAGLTDMGDCAPFYQQYVRLEN